MASQKEVMEPVPKAPPVAYCPIFHVFFVRMGNNYTMLSLWTLLKAPISGCGSTGSWSISSSAQYVTLQKCFSHPSFVFISPTPPIMLKFVLQIGGRLLIANQLDDSLWLADQKQRAAVCWTKTILLGWAKLACFDFIQFHTEHWWSCSYPLLHKLTGGFNFRAMGISHKYHTNAHKMLPENPYFQKWFVYTAASDFDWNNRLVCHLNCMALKTLPRPRSIC
jgi:hypothetical protein